MRSAQGDPGYLCLLSASAGLGVSLGSSPMRFVPAIDSEMSVLPCSSQYFSSMCCGLVSPRCWLSVVIPGLLPDLLVMPLCLSLSSWPFKFSQPVVVQFCFSFVISHHADSLFLLIMLNSLGTIYPPKWLKAIWESNLTRDT